LARSRKQAAFSRLEARECRLRWNTYPVKLSEQTMGAVLVSTKGQIVLPAAVRKALGLKPGMRVDIRVEGKGARISPAPAKNTAKLSEIQAILKYPGPRVPVKNMRVTHYKD
jgi:AbrB family looped-hinge helix DNA binding protein